MAKNKTYFGMNSDQRRQQIIDILSQTLIGQLKPPKKLENPQKSSQKALA